MCGCLPCAPPIGLASCVAVVATSEYPLGNPFPWSCRVVLLNVIGVVGVAVVGVFLLELAIVVCVRCSKVY